MPGASHRSHDTQHMLLVHHLIVIVFWRKILLVDVLDLYQLFGWLILWRKVLVIWVHIVIRWLENRISSNDVTRISDVIWISKCAFHQP
jgi:hypothetical protein